MKIKILAGGLLSVLLAAGITKITYRMIVGAPVNVLDSGATGDGTTDDSAAIQRAINSFGAAPACGTVVLPKGTYAIGTMLDINNREGCIFQGAGHGQATTSCSTTLKWTGAANGTVLRVFSTRWSSFKDFCIDGNSSAGIGIDDTALNATAPNQENRFNNITVKGITGSPGRAIHVGSATNDQISESSFDWITCLTSATCFYQDGSQTFNITYRGGLISHPTVMGLDIEGGQATTYGLDFENNTGSTIDVQVAGASSVGEVNFYHNYHEDIGSSTIVAYNLPSGTGRTAGTNWFGGYILYTSATGGTVVNYQQEGPVVMQGVTFNGNAPGQGGTVSFAGTGPSPNVASLYGTVFYQSNALACSGSSTCTWNGGGALTGSASSTQFRNQSPSLWGGALYLCDSTGANCFKLQSNSTQMRFMDGSSNILGGFAADTATVTGTWSAAKLRLGTGVAKDSGGLKHLRAVAGCATAASAGAACTTTVTWTTAFADSAYTVECQGITVTSGVPVLGAVTSKASTSVIIQTVAVTAAAAQFSTLECIAIHD